MGQALRILIADAHPLERAGLVSVLSTHFRDLAAQECATYADLLGCVSQDPPFDLIALDLGLPGLKGISGLGDFSRWSNVPFVVIGEAPTRDAVLAALSAGAQGYLPRNLEVSQVIEAFEAVRGGRIYFPVVRLDEISTREGMAPSTIDDLRRSLTERQFQVLEQLRKGLSNKQIARHLDIAESTVKVHLNAAFHVLGVHDRRSAVDALRRLDPTSPVSDDPLLSRMGSLTRQSRMHISTWMAALLGLVVGGSEYAAIL